MPSFGRRAVNYAPIPEAADWWDAFHRLVRTRQEPAAQFPKQTGVAEALVELVDWARMLQNLPLVWANYSLLSGHGAVLMDGQSEDQSAGLAGKLW